MVRNLSIYPVTLTEKIEAVKRAIEYIDHPDQVGSIAPIALREILEDLEEKKSQEEK